MKKILRFPFQHTSLRIKKTVLIFCALIVSAWYGQAQNVSIGTTTAPEKLTVNGNLLVQLQTITSTSSPGSANTFSLGSISVLYATDSSYRVYDPGGTGNYPPNTDVVTQIIDSAFFSQNQPAGLELSFELIDLGVGDTLAVIDLLTGSTIILRCGSNCNTQPYPKFSGIAFGIYFISNGDASVGQGFSAVVRKVYPAPSNNISNAGSYGVSALFFDGSKGALVGGYGNNRSEIGLGAVSLGTGTTASNIGSVAIGYGSTATGEKAVALGAAIAEGTGAVGIGGVASGLNSLAIGYSANASGTTASALTPNSSASGLGSVAIGQGSRAQGDGSLALLGGETMQTGNQSFAAGQGARSTGSNAVAIGKSARANGSSSFALGENTDANANRSVAIGYLSTAYGENAFAAGHQASASGVSSAAIGRNAQAIGAFSIAIGNLAAGTSMESIAMGNSARAYGQRAVAIGNNLTADGDYSMALGSYVSTSGYEGALTIGDRSTTTVMNTFVANGMRCRFANGYRFFTNSAANIGAFLNANANSWAALSDVRLKENFLPVNGEDILKKIGGMPQYTWNYKGQDVKTLRHYGPMAQDFYKAFGKDGLGEIGCDTLINQQDFLGVSFIAIQALEKRTADLLKENEALKATLQQQALDFKQEADDLKSRLEKLEKAFAAKQ